MEKLMSEVIIVERYGTATTTTRPTYPAELVCAINASSNSDTREVIRLARSSSPIETAVTSKSAMALKRNLMRFGFGSRRKWSVL